MIAIAPTETAMHIRTFRAANLNAALEMIRDQMGPEASVLHTRQLPGSVVPWWGRRRIEVTAGLRATRSSAAVPTRPAAGTPSPEHPAPTNTSPEPVAGSTANAAACRLAGTSATPLSGPLSNLLSSPLNGQLAGLVEELISAGLPMPLASHWAEQAGQGRQVAPRPAHCTGTDAAELFVEPQLRAELSQWLERAVPVGRPIPVSQGCRRIVALVGPTGVGKTTTIAKLAAGFQLRQKVRVGLLTLDTFRAAAIEQLDAFARTLHVPMEVVRRTDELGGALERLGDVDLVLVDTMGQSPRGEEKIAAMARLLAAAQPDETHLVLDANNSFRAVVDILAAYRPLRPTSAIISKLDEVRRPAPVIAALIDRPLEISYVTHGQMVPGDIATADRQSLAAAASGLAVLGCEA